MSKDTIEIREIRSEDNLNIAKTIRDVLIEFGVPKVGTAYEDKALDFMYETYSGKKSSYFVVEANSKIIGGAGIAPLENFDTSVCELQKMYFKSEARGVGLGTEMMTKCLSFAKSVGYRQCYLETMPYMDEARKLYRKFGFINLPEPLGNTGHYSCTVWMIKDL